MPTIHIPTPGRVLGDRITFNPSQPPAHRKAAYLRGKAADVEQRVDNLADFFQRHDGTALDGDDRRGYVALDSVSAIGYFQDGSGKVSGLLNREGDLVAFSDKNSSVKRDIDADSSVIRVDTAVSERVDYIEKNSNGTITYITGRKL